MISKLSSSTFASGWLAGRGLQLRNRGCFWGIGGSAGVTTRLLWDTESALLAAVANGLEGTGGLRSIGTTTVLLAAVATELEGTGAEVSPTINTGVLGVSVAVSVTVTGRFVVRKSRSMHF